MITLKETELTQEYLLDSLVYCPTNLNLVWKKRPRSHFRVEKQFKNWNSRYPGTVAGKVDNNGYLNIKLNYELYRAHRLIWFYFFNEWPECIDHIDGDKLNNSIDNLRKVTRCQNNQNASKRSDNKSGLTGVYWDKSARKWRAVINVNNKRVSLGRYVDFFEACCARKRANVIFNFSMTHGRDAV